MRAEASHARPMADHTGIVAFLPVHAVWANQQALVIEVVVIYACYCSTSLTIDGCSLAQHARSTAEMAFMVAWNFVLPIYAIMHTPVHVDLLVVDYSRGISFTLIAI